MQSWMRSLESAMAMKLQHYSCYALTYEPNTAMAVRKRLGHFKPATDELELSMMHATRRVLGSSGYAAYEISNYALSGEECRHNLLYWTGGNYVGLGPSASSHVAGHRFKNRAHLGEWERAIELGELPATDYEVLTPARRAGELVMLLLRLRDGIDYADYARRTGSDARAVYGTVLDRLSQLSLLECDERGFRLTESGIDVADAIAREFLLATPE
jgi:oxygen-independent coproporphyrinogen-3 oxidase